jgi:hypothetical protein
MGPVSTKWYRDRNIPFTNVEYTNRFGEIGTQEKYLQSYSCGRIDIYGLDYDRYYGGKHEYGLRVMLTKDWNALRVWLDKLKTHNLRPYKQLISDFEKHHGQSIRWYNEG